MAAAIFSVCRDAQMPEQLMQPRPLLTIDAVGHDVEIFFPIVDAVVAQQDLAEARAVRLHARVAFVVLDRAVPPKIMLRGQLASTAAPTSPPPG